MPHTGWCRRSTRQPCYSKQTAQRRASRTNNEQLRTGRMWGCLCNVRRRMHKFNTMSCLRFPHMSHHAITRTGRRAYPHDRAVGVTPGKSVGAGGTLTTEDAADSCKHDPHFVLQSLKSAFDVMRHKHERYTAPWSSASLRHPHFRLCCSATTKHRTCELAPQRERRRQKAAPAQIRPQASIWGSFAPPHCAPKAATLLPTTVAPHFVASRSATPAPPHVPPNMTGVAARACSSTPWRSGCLGQSSSTS